MKSYRRLGEVVAATLLLLAPAMWNGFPFLQYDTGGYLARRFEGYLEPSRSTVYGLFAVVGWRPPMKTWTLSEGARSHPRPKLDGGISPPRAIKEHTHWAEIINRLD